MLLGTEITPQEFDWIKGALLALPTIASAVTAWAVLSGRGKTPQPLIVKGEQQVATKEEVTAQKLRIDALEGDLASIRFSITESERRMLAEGSRRAGTLHKRIDDVEKDISTVPAKVVALLKDTKGLI